MFFSLYIATSLTIPSDRNKPEVSEEVRDLLKSGVTTGDTTEGTVSEGGGRGGIENPPVVLSVGDLVQIKKEIIPTSDNGYIVEDVVGVFIEVLCKQNLDEIHIKEFIENGPNIINISSNCYRLLTADEISDYEGGFNRGYFDNYKREDKSEIGNNGIHDNDLNSIKTYGSKCIYDLKNNINYQNNLVRFLREDLKITWAENASTNLNGSRLNVYNKSNNLQNITIILDNKKEYATLKLANIRYKFLVKCEDINCPSGEPITLADELKVVDLYSKQKLINLSIYTLKDDFDIYIKNARANERYAYWYYVRLNRPGNYDSSTIALISYGGTRNIPYIDASIKIKVANSLPNVNIRFNKLHILKNEDFDVTYEIKYARYSINNNTIVYNFPNLNDYYTFVNKTSNDGEVLITPNSTKLNQKNEAKINKRIKYLDSGEYYPPGITLNGEYFPFGKEKVYVETRFEKYVQLVTLIFGIITFFLKDKIFPSGNPNEINKKDPRNNRLSGRNWKNHPIYLSVKDFKTAIHLIVLKVERYFGYAPMNINLYQLILALAFIIIIIWFILDRPLSFFYLP